MAHEIEIINGQASTFTVGEAPWHKLGKRFITAPTLDEAIVAAGLDWEVTTEPVFTGAQEPVEAMITRRSSDKSILGVVGTTYKPVQNKEAFDFFKPFIDSGACTIETAGSLRQGRRVWVQAKIKADPFTVKGNDTVEAYVLLSNSHDGTTAVRTGFTPQRVVCQNTLAMAHGDRASKFLRIRHTQNVLETLSLARDAMNLASREFEASVELYQRLARRDIVKSDLENYVKLIFNTPKEIEAKGNLANIDGKRIFNQIEPLFEVGRGNDMPEIRGTAWAAYNAVTEYLQYKRGTDDQLRLDKLWFGEGRTLNQKALEVALAMVG